MKELYKAKREYPGDLGNYLVQFSRKDKIVLKNCSKDNLLEYDNTYVSRIKYKDIYTVVQKAHSLYEAGERPSFIL